MLAAVVVVARLRAVLRGRRGRRAGAVLGAVLQALLAVLATPTSVQAIAGGVPAKEREYPFVAAFVRRTGTCTAIVLTEHWLLTAAHCYTMRGRSESNPYLTDVYAGLVDVHDVARGAVHGCGPGCQHRESHLVHFHPHFRPRASRSSYDDAHHNNLALLHVSKAFWLDTDWVRAAVRAPAPTKVCSCKVVGFGMGGVGPHAFAPGRLLKADRVPILPFKLCPPSRVNPMPRATLCSDSKVGVAPCLGDAGAPVICDGMVAGMALGVYESQWEYKGHSFYCGFLKSCSLFGLYASLEPYKAWLDSAVFRASQAGVVSGAAAQLGLLGMRLPNASQVGDPDAEC